MNTILQAGDRQIDLSTPVCMGILNVTPDSFFDGSQLAVADAEAFTVDLEKVLARARQMADAGATILDIGGESTRPGAQAVSPEERCV